MLQKKYRISNRADYNFIYQNGKKIHSRYIIVFITANQLAYNRFGIVTSKKVGNAVHRNQARRRLRAIIQKHMPEIKQGYDLVMVARFNIKEAMFAALEKDFLIAAKKAGLI
jgi:ribonuclease P protein component